MRRNAIAMVLFALALGLKVLLPAVAVVHASHPNSSQIAFQDCLSAAVDGALDQTKAPGKTERHAANCPLCQISCEGAFALLERSPQLVPLVFIHRAAPWRLGEFAQPRAPPRNDHQARAPPHFS